MKKHKTYAIVCLISLLLFFTGPIAFISDVVFDSLTDIKVEASDLIDGESESENEVPSSFEEEQHAATFEMELAYREDIKKATNNLYLHSHWKSMISNTITPPPDKA